MGEEKKVRFESKEDRVTIYPDDIQTVDDWAELIFRLSPYTRCPIKEANLTRT